MSRFFNQSADEQDENVLSGPTAEQNIDQLLEDVRSTEEQQVVSVRLGGSDLEQFGGAEVKTIIGDAGESLPVGKAAAPAFASRSPLARATLPTFPGRIASSDGKIMARVEEGFRLLRTRLLRAQASQGFRSVVITSAAPNEGKTLTAANLGLSSVQLSDVHVLLIDADLRTHGLTELLRLPNGPGLSDVLAGTVTYENAITATDVPRLDVLGAGECTSDAAPELLAKPTWRQFIAWASKKYSLVLVDAPPVIPLADYELISAGCKKILTVVRARRTKRALLQKCAKLIDRHKRLATVFNGNESVNKDAYMGYYAYGYGKPAAKQAAEQPPVATTNSK